MIGHILTVGYVVRAKFKVAYHGYGKRRAWCNKCRSLKPNTSFYCLRVVPNPDSETGLYYEGHYEYVCSDCAKPVRIMPKREYLKRIRATCREAFKS